MDENITCMSCYKKIGADYVYCFMCNRKKDSLTYCAKIKQNGYQCKFKCVNDYCFYHRKYDKPENKDSYKDVAKKNIQ